MAAYALPAPGTRLGPCLKGCQHKDCEATRQQAEKVCHFCGEPCGYGRRIYLGNGTHEACEYDAEMARQAFPEEQER